MMPGKSRVQLKAEDVALKEGRASKSAYHPGFDRRATDYAMLGASNEELAQLFGVSVSAIQKWLVERPSFARAVRKGRVEADAKVARSMYRAAVGYKHGETRVRRDQKGQIIEKTEIRKEQAPNVNAGVLWLTNRAGSKWRDRKVADAVVTMDLGDLVREALERRQERAATTIEGTAQTVEDKPE
jgi:hypothetical protein